MARKIRPVGYDDRLSLVEHLDELRTRLIICVTAFLVCFGFCFWQDEAVLDFMNRPLQLSAFKADSGDPFEQTAEFQQKLGALAAELAEALSDPALVADPQVREQLEGVGAAAAEVAAATPDQRQRNPVTIGVGEPFFTTLTVAGYGGLLLALPLLLYQAYAFILPAFSPREKQVALPLLLMVPVLFLSGVAFGYYVVLPKAIDFLQNFNDESFDILLQARDYYRFSILALTAMGLLFQIPVAIIGLVRAGVVSVAQLRKNRRYALVVIAVMAMLLPGTDPVTMLFAMAPLVVLFEASILISAVFERRVAMASDDEDEDEDDPDSGDDDDDPEPGPSEPYALTPTSLPREPDIP